MKDFTIILIITIMFSSCQKERDDQYFRKIRHNDPELPAPEWNDWLAVHKEKGQSLEQFIDCERAVPKVDKDIIYIAPIGEFNDLQRQQIELLKEYLAIFFQLETKILKPISSNLIPKYARRFGAENQEQLLTHYLLDSILPKRKPTDAVAVMAVSEKDLFPKEDWNYVFGQASFQNKVAVSSIFRLQEKELSEKNFKLCLIRLLKVSSHEIGHMFGLRHCIDANCVMNGSNNLTETDKNPSRLCSKCQQKLSYSIEYDNLKRLSETISYFKKNALTEESILLEKDLTLTK